MRVLIPSNERAFLVNIAEGYQSLGHVVSLGAVNFYLDTSPCEIMHVLWPEELAYWKKPSHELTSEIETRLNERRRHSSIVFTVNNIYPHGGYKDLDWHRLYSAFFRHADVIHHLSQASKALVDTEYPEFAGHNHVVTAGFNYEALLRHRRLSRREAREKYGIGETELVFLLFGALRTHAEISLIQRAFRIAAIPNRRILFAARFQAKGGRIRRRLQHASLGLWQRWESTINIPGYVPDSQIPELFDAADIVVVVREESLSSGIPSLAMTFGRYVVAPRLHAVHEYLIDTDNGLYTPGSAASLAEQLHAAQFKDREAIGQRNAAQALEWKWADSITRMLSALPPDRSEMADLVAS